jgi:hypothetical protein
MRQTAKAWKSSGCRSAWIAALLCGTLTGRLLTQAAEQADPKTISIGRTPLVLSLMTALSAEDSQPGDAAVMLLESDYFYGSHRLPRGTTLKGWVRDVKQSKNFGRAGMLALELDALCAPAGSSGKVATRCKTLMPVLDKPLMVKLYHPDVQANKMTWADAGVSAGTTALGFFLPTASFAVQAVYETQKQFRKDPERQRSALRKIGQGTLEATGLPGAVRFVRKAPNPDYASRAQVQLHFSRRVLSGLLLLSEALPKPPLAQDDLKPPKPPVPK